MCTSRFSPSLIHGLCAIFASNLRFMRLFQAPLDTCLDSPFLPASQFTLCTSQFTRPRRTFFPLSLFLCLKSAVQKLEKVPVKMFSVKSLACSSGAGNVRTNFMGTWDFLVLSAGKPHANKIPPCRGGVLGSFRRGGGVVEVPILFLWARGFF